MVAPVDRTGIQQHHQAGESQSDSCNTAPGLRLLEDHPGKWRNPERRRVGQDNRPSDFGMAKPGCDERGEPDHVQQPDRQYDRNIPSPGNDEIPAPQLQQQQDGAGDRRPDGRCPQRRHAFDDRFGYDPVDSPGQYHDGEQEKRFAAGKDGRHAMQPRVLHAPLFDQTSKS